MPVTLINVFNVPAEKEEEFLLHWKQTTDVFRRKKGFVETHLHRNTGVGNQTFQFVNIAKWESAEAWRSIHDEYQPSEYTLAGVKGHPAIFESVMNVHSTVLEEPYIWTW
ncbi:antibiotic biosynthesis monooxygenase family protein [Pseudomonas prosekii]|uniref:antibiotic biosynthesis monooxygenase family protein n=1 Tax=Pseudomonas prosekii TaxID=1148509 RepID=UPI0011EB581F|nr:antibiotic biosynthesis monooxygenase family protein [Pseudomonas prosekii]